MASLYKLLKSALNPRPFKKQLLYIVLTAFLAAFAVARSWSLLIGNSIYIRGYHIHHFYFGALLLACGGLVALLTEKPKFQRAAAGLLGIGVGLFADELGLLLNCTTTARPCLYAFPDSGDIIGFIALCLFLLLIIVDLAEKPVK